MENTEQTKMVHLPIDKLSYSGLTQLLRNPLIFKLKQILGVYNGKSGVSAMIGRAAHEALKAYYGGNKDVAISKDPTLARGESIDIGLKYLTNYADEYIRYGKTGSREDMLKGYIQAMNVYFAEEPTYHKILACEERMEAHITTNEGQILPLPAVGVPDLVHQFSDNEEDVEIIDTKFVKAFTKYEDEEGDPFEDYIKIVQSKFLDRLLVATKNIKAKRVVFREVKRSINKDGGNQIRDYIIPLDHEPYDIIFNNLYRDVVKFISNPDSIYLPNLSDQYDGEQAGLLYAQGLLNSDMSDVEVMHKVKDVALVSKKFVPSRLDRIENTNLLPEEKIKLRLAEFGIPVEPVDTHTGPSVIQYRFKVSAGIRMSTILKHKSDIARAIEAKGEVRILAPIPGTSLVGVEVAAEERKSVKLTKAHLVPNTLSLPIGVDIQGEVIRKPLNEMPHLLIAGSTGSGKSVLLHGLIESMIKQMKPSMMELILVDPKRVELTAFSKAKHLHGKKVLYEYKDVLRVLLETKDEMEHRYTILEQSGKRDIEEYNEYAKGRELPYRVIVFDEFADFMLRSKMEKTKSTNYRSRSKTWLYNTLKKRVGKRGDFFLKDDENGDENGLTRHTLHTQRDYDKDSLADILEAMDSMDSINSEEADVEVLVSRIAAMGRAAGIHLIIATQRPSVDVITGLIKANFPTRIALTTASPTDSIVILGEAGAEKLTGKGDMLFMHPGNNGRVRLQGFMI